MKKKCIHLGNSDVLVRVDPKLIAYIKSIPGKHKSMIITIDKKELPVNHQLGDIRLMLEAQLKGEAEFFRIGDSLIINCDYLHKIILSEKKIVLLSPNTGEPIEEHVQVDPEYLSKIRIALEKSDLGGLTAYEYLGALKIAEEHAKKTFKGDRKEYEGSKNFFKAFTSIISVAIDEFNRIKDKKAKDKEKKYIEMQKEKFR